MGSPSRGLRWKRYLTTAGAQTPECAGASPCDYAAIATFLSGVAPIIARHDAHTEKAFVQARQRLLAKLSIEHDFDKLDQNAS
jgi:hypothetical protein